MQKTVRRHEEIAIRRHLFGSDGAVPNNADLPVLLMGGALRPGAEAAAVEAAFRANGWGGTWRGTIFAHHHFHPDAHEALGCLSGWAEVILGGPSGVHLRLAAGDVVVLSAGTGHCRAAASGDFAICGAYPAGQERFSTVAADGPGPPDPTMVAAIRRVPRPASDPLYGAAGPLRAAWG